MDLSVIRPRVCVARALFVCCVRRGASRWSRRAGARWYRGTVDELVKDGAGKIVLRDPLVRRTTTARIAPTRVRPHERGRRRGSNRGYSSAAASSGHSRQKSASRRRSVGSLGLAEPSTGAAGWIESGRPRVSRSSSPGVRQGTPRASTTSQHSCHWEEYTRCVVGADV